MSEDPNVFDNRIDTTRGADLTGYRTIWRQEMARKGKVTAQKLAGRWVFNKSDLLHYKHKMDSLGHKKHAVWQEPQQ